MAPLRYFCKTSRDTNRHQAHSQRVRDRKTARDRQPGIKGRTGQARTGNTGHRTDRHGQTQRKTGRQTYRQTD